MDTTRNGSAELGEIVAAVMHEAGQYSDDPREVTRMAARVVSRILERGRPKRGFLSSLLSDDAFDDVVEAAELAAE